MRIVSTVLAVLLCGCASATRLSIEPREGDYHVQIHHTKGSSAAFSSTEVALAEAYADLPRVLKLRQPETGSFLLKPLVSYQVGGWVGATCYSAYTLKIVV